MSKTQIAVTIAAILIVAAGIAGWSYLGGIGGIVAGILILVVIIWGIFGAFMSFSEGNIKGGFGTLIGVVAAVGMILGMLYLWNQKNMPKVNTASYPTECSIVMSTLGAAGTPCPTSREGWISFINSRPISSEIGNRDWKSELIEILLKPCPTTYTVGEPSCDLDQEGFAQRYAQYQSGLDEAIRKINEEKAREQQQAAMQESAKEDAKETKLPEMAAVLMSLGGIMGVLNFWVAVPFFEKKFGVGSKITASLVLTLIVWIVSASNLWTTISTFVFGANADAAAVRHLIWTGFWTGLALPIIGLIAFGIGMLVGEAATKAKGGGVFFGILAALLALLGGGLGVLPGWLNTLFVVDSGLDHWIATQALFFGQGVLLPGLTSFLGTGWTVLSTLASGMKFLQAVDKMSG